MPTATVSINLSPIASGSYASDGSYNPYGSAYISSTFVFSSVNGGFRYSQIVYDVFDPKQLTGAQIAGLKQGTVSVVVNFTTSTSDAVPHDIGVTATELQDPYQNAAVNEDYANYLNGAEGITDLLVYGYIFDGQSGTYTYPVNHAGYPSVTVAAYGQNDGVQQSYNITGSLLHALDGGRDLVLAFYETSGGISYAENVSITGGGTAEVGVTYVSSGQTVNSSVVFDDNTQVVRSGGRAVNTLLQGGTQDVTFGGSASFTTVSARGNLVVEGGGSLNGAYVSSGGVVNVRSASVVTNVGVGSGGQVLMDFGSTVTSVTVNLGGTLSDFGGVSTGTILSGGLLTVSGIVFTNSSGAVTSVTRGVASATTVGFGGTLDVRSLGTAVGTVVSAYGSEIVHSGGVTSNTLVDAVGSEVVSAGGVAGGARVMAGGTLLVSSGGASVSASLDPGGLAVVSSGGLASGTTVSSGGTLRVATGGTVSGLAVGAGGSVLNAGLVSLVAGNVASGVTVQAGGTLIVANSALAVGATVQSQGSAAVALGGTASGTLVSSGGSLFVSGAAIGTVLVGGGQMTVAFGGTAVGSIVSSGGVETLLAASTASGTLVTGGNQVVVGGAVTSNVTVTEGNGTQTVSGGVTYGTVLLSAGLGRAGQQFVVDGVAVGTLVSGGVQEVNGTTASAVSTVVGSGGYQLLYAGAATSATVSGGTQYLYGGRASGTVVSAGGLQSVESGGTALRTAVGSAGRMVVSAGGSADGAVIGSGGALRIENASPTATTVSSGGVVEVVGIAATGLQFRGGAEILFSGASQGSVSLNSVGLAVLTVSSGASASSVRIEASGQMVVSSGGNANGTSILSGGRATFVAGGTINSTTLAVGGTVDLQYLAFARGGTASLNSATNVLTISQGGQTTTLGLAGGYAGEYFHLNQDVDGSTLLTQDANPACYCHGTMIQTDRGEVSVEALAIGDQVVTASGAVRPVVWLGRRSYAGRFLRANPGVQPVRFRAGSLGEGLPRRDLLVSPNHAMLLDGLLVPAGLLMNGTAISRESGMVRVDYVHVELDTHDVLLAEGAPSESFVDDNSRGTFHNVDEWAQMHPGRTRIPAMFCAPRVEDGPELEAIRRQLSKVADRTTVAAA